MSTFPKTLEELKTFKITSKFYLERVKEFFKNLSNTEQIEYLEFNELFEELDNSKKIQAFLSITIEK